jgi:hypothetical protein
MARRKLWKGVVAGGAAGLVGTFAMTEFQALSSKASEQLAANGQRDLEGLSGQESEDATMEAAGKMAELFGRRLSHEEKQKAAPFVHYGFGTAMGIVYGALMELGPCDLRRQTAERHWVWQCAVRRCRRNRGARRRTIRAARWNPDFCPFQGFVFPFGIWSDHGCRAQATLDGIVDGVHSLAALAKRRNRLCLPFI